MAKIKIAFIKTGGFSHINKNVLAQLQRQFPDYQIDVWDIRSDIIPVIDLYSILFCIKEYGFRVAFSIQELRKRISRTEFAFRRVKRIWQKKIAFRDYLFTFQTQSIFDLSIPGMPHFVYTDHTHLINLSYPMFARKNLNSKAWIALEKTIYNNAELIFTMSSNVQGDIIEHYGCLEDKVKNVRAGTNIFPVSQEFPIARYSKQNILFVGVAWERKGGPVLVEAFQRILRRHPQAQLTIVGCSPDLNLPNCNVIGRVSLEETKKYYQDASIFCMPTRIEPFGIAFLEAMAFNLPVIATNIGATSDFVDHGVNGYLVEPDNVDDVEKRLDELLASPEKCRDLGSAGHDIVVNNYTWDLVGERIGEHIRRALDLE